MERILERSPRIGPAMGVGRILGQREHQEEAWKKEGDPEATVQDEGRVGDAGQLLGGPVSEGERVGLLSASQRVQPLT